jgi:hypothetical protein
MKNSDAIKKIFDYDLIAMSYHEACHTVIALFNYLQVYHVNVMTPKRSDGNTNFFIYDEIVKDEDLKKIFSIFEIQTMYAGLVGERMYYRDICGSSKFPMHLKKDSAYDIGIASAIIRKNNLASPGKKTHLFKKEVQFDVEKILDDHWDAVKEIAHSVYRKKRLSFDELKYILTRKTDQKEFWKDKFRKMNIIYSNNKPTEEVVKELVLENLIFKI